MLKVFFLFLYFTLGLALPYTDQQTNAAATLLSSTMGEANPTQDLGAAVITNLPTASLGCYLEGYLWSPEQISSAMVRATECAASAGGCFWGTKTHYPHPYVNSQSPKWNCGGTAAASFVQEFPLMPYGDLYTGGDPKVARVFYKLSATLTYNPVGYTTNVMYCGVAKHEPVGTGFIRCDGATVASADATPTVAAEL
ncbi:hypothetical protein F66182_6943 [Fusarium sp. NRRL 66182]|nr:hypothetical protein F66182_6943 [Fusarium sp. NRRL 66182]